MEENSDQIKNRLVEEGCTVALGNSVPEMDSLRIRVSHRALGEVTRFIPWVQMDQAVDDGEELLRSTLEDIDLTLHRHCNLTE